MNKTIHHLASILFIMFIVSCYSDLDEQAKTNELQLNKLQEKIKTDSLALVDYQEKMQMINYTLDFMTLLNDDFKESESISRSDVLAKLDLIQLMLADSYTKVDMLNHQLDSIKTPYVKNLVFNNMEEIQQKLYTNADYYAKLRSQIEILENENINLKEIIQGRNEVIEAQKRQLQQKDMVIDSLSDMHQLIVQEIDSIRLVMEHNTEETAESYYIIGIEIKHVADNTTKFFNRKKKATLINLAHCYFKKASQMGKKEAAKELDIIENSKEYSSLLKDGAIQ